MHFSRMIAAGAWFCLVASTTLAADDTREQLYKQHLKNSRKTGSYLEVKELVLDVVKLTDQALQADDFPLATKCAHLAVESAEKTGNGLLAFQAQQKKTQVAACGKAATRIARHLKTLKTSSNDAGACLEVGRFACALKDDWAIRSL